MSEAAHIRQSIRDILLTPVGSRVMRREYGSLIPELIDEPFNDTTRLRLIAASVIALAKYEPRIQIDAADITVDSGCYALTLDIGQNQNRQREQVFLN